MLFERRSFFFVVRVVVLPAYDIRTDRWAIAQEAMDKNRKAIDAKRKADYDLMLNGKENDVKADKSAEAKNGAVA